MVLLSILFLPVSLIFYSGLLLRLPLHLLLVSLVSSSISVSFLSTDRDSVVFFGFFHH